MNSHTFNPAFPGLPQNVIQHAVRFHPYPTVNAPLGEFEEIHRYPSFVLQSSWYDDMPPSVGAVWAGFPTAVVWNALAPRDTVRNLRGRMAAVAYRTHGGQPFHYIVLSYDERGRVEAQLRLTENIGFDAVYYRYNALNKITSVHVVDATGQHATFYGYDSEGRVSKMWAERSNGIAYGLGTSMTPQRPTLIELNRQALPHAVYGYDAADAVTSVDYPRLGVTTTIDVNARGAQLRTRTQTSDLLARTIFEQRLGYDDLDQITNAWSLGNGAIENAMYQYDALGRTVWARTNGPNNALVHAEMYAYDQVGNRRSMLNDIYGIVHSYTHAPTTNRLTGFVQGDVATPGYRSHTLGYHSDGALATRERTDVQGGRTVARSESFAYDAFGLIERYRVQRDVGGLQGSCTPDAALQPISEWRYRFGPLQEREQKRQYSSDIPADGLAWTYTLLGADAKQLASYNGIQGAFCGQPPTTAWLWPVEYNSYGPAHTRLIMRPTGAVEYVLHDHLGSARITLDNAARVIESRSYTAFGDELTSSGTGARTSYIGRETDNESDLGFYGVRLYDPTYGRFLSTDPLWKEFAHLTPYHYSENTPIIKSDPSGAFPWGVVIGAAVEVASQMIFENRSVSEIDGGRVLIAAAAGGLTGGLSAFSSATTRIVGTAVISVAEGAAKRAVSGEETTVGDVAFDGIAGGAIGGTADVLASAASKSPAGKMVTDALRREENTLAGGRTRAAQVAAVESARDAVGQIGRGVKEESVLGLVSFGLQGASKIMTNPVSRDNTAVAMKPIVTKP